MMLKTPACGLRVFAFSCFTLYALLFLLGCNRASKKSTVLAQVGDSTLTLEELRESYPAELEQLIRREQYLDFIKRWMDDEIVYQQALKMKLETDTTVGRKLEKLRRKLLIEEFLARENSTEVFEPDELSMSQYYEMYKEKFRRKATEFKFAHIRVETSKEANDLRNKAVRGDFLALASGVSLDPVPESYASIGFKKQSEIPGCLSQDLAKTSTGSVTPTLVCPDGFYVAKLLEREDAGSLIPFPEAKEEISAILIMDRKDKVLEGRIAKYKEGVNVGYNLDLIPGLTENSKPLEVTQPAEHPPAVDPKPSVVDSQGTASAPEPPIASPQVKAKNPPRNRVAKATPRIVKDTVTAKITAPKAPHETTTEYPDPKSEAAENNNAQSPSETP